MLNPASLRASFWDTFLYKIAITFPKELLQARKKKNPREPMVSWAVPSWHNGFHMCQSMLLNSRVPIAACLITNSGI